MDSGRSIHGIRVQACQWLFGDQRIPAGTLFYERFYLDVSKNSGTSKSSILIGFSIINHPFWDTLFLETPICSILCPFSSTPTFTTFNIRLLGL